MIHICYTIALCSAIGGGILFVRETARAVFPMELAAAAATGMAAAVIPMVIAVAVDRTLSPLIQGDGRTRTEPPSTGETAQEEQENRPRQGEE